MKEHVFAGNDRFWGAKSFVFVAVAVAVVVVAVVVDSDAVVTAVVCGLLFLGRLLVLLLEFVVCCFCLGRSLVLLLLPLFLSVFAVVAFAANVVANVAAVVAVVGVIAAVACVAVVPHLLCCC